ncbi:hypothetical protein [Granulicella mallensis]|uniref:hypothetical protein n=1 Tax=Granulicella mallensis TaxID=940614 RepID=UPI0012379E3B|nr:hypothetical protein [Granulicella mallensis]
MEKAAVFCETSTVDSFGSEGAAHARQFLAQLQTAIRHNDKQQVAVMVEYPLKGDSPGNREIVIRSPGEFETSYDKIVTARVKRLVLNQRPTCLNGQAVTNDEVILGAGDMYFESKDKGASFKITALDSDAGHLMGWSVPPPLAKATGCESSGGAGQDANCKSQTVDGLGPVGAAQARNFLKRLQSAVRSNDRGQVASMVSYPLRGESPGNVETVIKSAEQFEATYDRIMTERVKKLVLNQLPSPLRGEVLFDHTEVAILGKMDVYFEDNKKGDGFKVVTIESGEHNDGSWSAYIAPPLDLNCVAHGNCGDEIPGLTAGCDSSTVDGWGPTSAAQIRAFVVNLQDAIRSNDKTHVASLVHYPIRINYYYGSRQLWIRSKRQFVESYDLVMTESLKKAILGESPRCVFENVDGIMLVNGSIWIDAYDGYKLRSILVH